MDITKCGTMASLESLPNEILVKIVFLASHKEDCWGGYEIDYDFVVNVIRKVSRRFEDIADDQWVPDIEHSVFSTRLLLKWTFYSKSSLWKIVDIQNGQSRAIENYNGNGTHATMELTIRDVFWTATSNDLISLAAKFQNIQMLKIISWFGS